MIENNEAKRFADPELADFHKQFQKHVDMFNERVKTDDARHQGLILSQQKTTEQLDSLIKNTGEIVSLYTDVKSTIKIGVAIQRFFLWVAKWGFVGAIATGIWEFVIKRLPH